MKDCEDGVGETVCVGHPAHLPGTCLPHSRHQASPLVQKRGRGTQEPRSPYLARWSGPTGASLHPVPGI